MPTNSFDKCRNCGGDGAIHHYQTDQCPVGGVEAPIGRDQEWKTSTFQVDVPFDPPSRRAEDMTVREYFAAMAMQGLMANYYHEFRHQDLELTTASFVAVNCADALIAALNKEVEAK